MYYKLRPPMYEGGRRREKAQALFKCISLFGYKRPSQHLVLAVILSMLSPIVALKISDYLSRTG
jgi:hypothetical protein